MRINEVIIENTINISGIAKKFIVDPSLEKFYDKHDELEYRQLVNINTEKFDNAWSQSNLYIGSGGTNQIKTRYQQFGLWLQTSKEPIIASTVDVDYNGAVSFYNGRHRFAWLRDMGVQIIPVAMDM